jgi:signal transduction histidine kinase
VINPKEHLILYVDDERPNRVVFEQSFAARFRLRAVASGGEALEVLRAEPVAVLVTDQRMPQMTGEELLAQAKSLWPDTVRVVITAYSDLDPILSAVNEGLVARYIIKPWDRAELEQILLWAIEAFVLSREGSALQLRLMQTERLVTLGSIAASVVHDLKQPLGNILVNSERLAHLARSVARIPALLDAPGTALSAEDRQNLADLAVELPEIAPELLESCTVMRNITDGIRAFSNARRHGETAAADPLPVIRHALAVCRETAVRARGKLIYDGPESLPKVRINQTELSQVLINLIANAAQALLAREQKGGRVVVRAEPRPASNGAAAAVWFTVTDDGPGMSPQVLQRVGQPFFSTREGGTGLGLAQSKRLVSRSGGDLIIDSREGAGTTVSFALPCA